MLLTLVSKNGTVLTLLTSIFSFIDIIVLLCSPASLVFILLLSFDDSPFSSKQVKIMTLNCAKKKVIKYKKIVCFHKSLKKLLLQLVK